MRNFSATACGLTVLIGLGFLSVSCNVVDSGKTMDDRQNQALKDPFHYSATDDIPDITGGGIGDYDPKAMQRDINHVFN